MFHSLLSLGLPSISFVASPVSAGDPGFLSNKPGNICLHLILLFFAKYVCSYEMISMSNG